MVEGLGLRKACLTTNSLEPPPNRQTPKPQSAQMPGNSISCVCVCMYAKQGMHVSPFSATACDATSCCTLLDLAIRHYTIGYHALPLPLPLPASPSRSPLPFPFSPVPLALLPFPFPSPSPLPLPYPTLPYHAIPYNINTRKTRSLHPSVPSSRSPAHNARSYIFQDAKPPVPNASPRTCHLILHFFCSWVQSTSAILLVYLGPVLTSP